VKKQISIEVAITSRIVEMMDSVRICPHPLDGQQYIYIHDKPSKMPALRFKKLQKDWWTG